MELEGQIASLQRMLADATRQNAENHNKGDLSASYHPPSRLVGSPSSHPGPSNAFQTVSQSDDWIFPSDVIQDALQCYFNYCNIWPNNFMHEISFMSSWSRQPRALVYSLCALGAEKSQRYSTMLCSYGERQGIVFFMQSRKLLELDEASFENLLTVMHLIVYASELERFKIVWMYSSIIATMIPMLMLNIDPDELEEKYGHRWTVVEKEMRRRVWWSSIVVTESNTIKLQAKVKKPLPHQVFSSLTDTVYTLDSNLLLNPTNIQSELESLADGIQGIAESVRFMLHNSYTINTADNTQLFAETNEINLRLQNWKSNLPSWMNAVATPKIVHSNQSPISPSTSLFWFANTLHLLYHSITLGVYRFTLIDLCKQQNGQSVPMIPYSHTIPYQHSKLASTSIIAFLKEIMVQFDPKGQNSNLLTLTAIINAGIFVSCLSRFGDTFDVRESCRKDAAFISSLCQKLSKSRWKICSSLMNTLESLKSTGTNEICIEIIEKFMISPLKTFEEHTPEPPIQFNFAFSNNFNSQIRLTQSNSNQTPVTVSPHIPEYQTFNSQNNVGYQSAVNPSGSSSGYQQFNHQSHEVHYQNFNSSSQVNDFQNFSSNQQVPGTEYQNFNNNDNTHRSFHNLPPINNHNEQRTFITSSNNLLPINSEVVFAMPTNHVQPQNGAVWTDFSGQPHLSSIQQQQQLSNVSMQPHQLSTITTIQPQHQLSNVGIPSIVNIQSQNSIQQQNSAVIQAGHQIRQTQWQAQTQSGQQQAQHNSQQLPQIHSVPIDFQ
ncbi:hypothetical protein HK096_003832 [Nowakowskiella sp. JEL0078]|nr:hypothetical protein HK096_003832 [Nowakowskiella sp. JEL0078]